MAAIKGRKDSKGYVLRTGETQRVDGRYCYAYTDKNKNCHHLRHTFCTRLCENESNLKVIQSVMGHSDIQTTMDIYAECTAEKKQEVFATLNGKIMIK